MNFNDILGFFLYVIPGFISTEIYRAKYPGKKGSDFNQLTWSIIISIIFICITRWADNCFKWQLFPPNTNFPRIRTILILIGLSVIFSLLRIVKRELAEKHNWLKILKVKPLAIWPFVNNDLNTEWACVTLSDGSKYLGYISNWTYDPNETDQDFLLSKAQKIDDNFNTIYEIDGKGVYLRTSWIISIEFFNGEAINEFDQTLKEAAPTEEKQKSKSSKTPRK